MKSLLWILLFLVAVYSCTVTKKADADGRLVRITMNESQQTDSIVQFSRYFWNSVFRNMVFLDKNFKVDSTGHMTLGDTIWVQFVMTRKGLTIGADTLVKHGGLDSIPPDR